MSFPRWSDLGRGNAEVARVLKPGGRWLLAEFVASGFVGFIRRVLRLHQFPERAGLQRRLLASGLQVVADERVDGLYGQVARMALAPRARSRGYIDRWSRGTWSPPCGPDRVRLDLSHSSRSV